MRKMCAQRKDPMLEFNYFAEDNGKMINKEQMETAYLTETNFFMKNVYSVCNLDKQKLNTSKKVADFSISLDEDRVTETPSDWFIDGSHLSQHQKFSNWKDRYSYDNDKSLIDFFKVSLSSQDQKLTNFKKSINFSKSGSQKSCTDGFSIDLADDFSDNIPDIFIDETIVESPESSNFEINLNEHLVDCSQNFSVSYEIPPKPPELEINVSFRKSQSAFIDKPLLFTKIKASDSFEMDFDNQNDNFLSTNSLLLSKSSYRFGEVNSNSIKSKSISLTQTTIIPTLIGLSDKKNGHESPDMFAESGCSSLNCTSDMFVESSVGVNKIETERSNKKFDATISITSKVEERQKKRIIQRDFDDTTFCSQVSILKRIESRTDKRNIKLATTNICDKTTICSQLSSVQQLQKNNQPTNIIKSSNYNLTMPTLYRLNNFFTNQITQNQTQRQVIIKKIENLMVSLLFDLINGKEIHFHLQNRRNWKNCTFDPKHLM